MPPFLFTLQQDNLQVPRHGDPLRVTALRSRKIPVISNDSTLLHIRKLIRSPAALQEKISRFGNTCLNERRIEPFFNKL
jgi:hypothetical protein